LEEKRNLLIEFKDKLKKYNQLQSKQYPNPQEESLRSELREWINRNIPLASSYIGQSGQSTTIYYSPPPITGGVRGNMDLFANIFQLNQYQISHSMIYDLLDRAIGTYDYWIKIKWRKWVNPFYWAGELIRLPFKILKFAGFDGIKLEGSTIGKLYKFLAAFGAAILLCFELYDHIKPLINLSNF